MQSKTLSALLFSERDVKIDRLNLYVGNSVWPLEKIGKIEIGEQSAFPPKNFLIAEGVVFLLFILTSGFLSFLFFIAIFGLYVWWYLALRKYSLITYDTTDPQF